MTDKYATLTTIRSEIKPGTKTVWIETERTTEDITREHYDNCVKAAPFFRRIGGSETLTREYTRQGYLVTRIVSKSPDRTQKTERIFKFD